MNAKINAFIQINRLEYCKYAFYKLYHNCYVYKTLPQGK